MTTTMTKEFVRFETWQSVRKVANEAGVQFYSRNDRHNDGYGLRWVDWKKDQDRIYIEGYERVYTDNRYTQTRIRNLAIQNFKLKMELWGIKTGHKVTFHTDGGFSGTISDYIQIEKIGA